MIKNIYKSKILILDFGSQYTQLIARRIREIGVYCKIFYWNIKKDIIKNFLPNGIILSGGPDSVKNNKSPKVPKYIFKLNIPILGICYGLHTMVDQLGGIVKKSKKKEYGYSKVEIIKNNILIEDIKDKFSLSGKPLLDVWMSHCDKVYKLPKNFINIAKTNTCEFAIIANEKKKFYGIQFHPEVTHTFQGKKIFKKFVINICKCNTNWFPKQIIKNKINFFKKKIKKDNVILAFSGGIDSLVTAIILNKAIGKRLICIFIDHGMLRFNEKNKILKIFKKKYKFNLIILKKEKTFFNAIKGIKNPEEKRKIIGKTFIKIFYKQSLILNNIKWLAQGTIYPDIIESMSFNNKKNNVIKSHHNVGGLPKNIKLKLIEPLKELFKDEVKKIGKEFKIDNEIINSHPFPGPGLSIRIIGEVKKKYCDLLRKADKIFLEELKKSNLYYKISQAFVVFLPIKSVGIIGDKRQYEWVVSLRAVETIDFMTAKWSFLPYNLLEKVSRRIINEVDNISRVVYDISNKPPSTIEWE